MKLGVFTCLLGNLPLEEVQYFKSKGIMVEIGCGGYPGNSMPTRHPARRSCGSEHLQIHRRGQRP